MTRPDRYRHAHLAPTLGRWRGRLLDPANGVSGRPAAAPTAYRCEGLLVHTRDPVVEARVRAAIDEAIGRRDWTADHQPSAVGLRPGASSVEPIDSWPVVSQLRAHPDPEIAAAVALDHLMTTAEQVGGNPFALGHGQTGLDRYGVSGYSGRGPVNYVIPAPPASAAGHRPRVVVLDTGIGDHPWFRARPAQTTITLADGSVIGPQIDPASIQGIDADGSGAIADPLLGTLASHTGHGTFIAGLIRQACPEADIVALAVMGADGIVAESTLTDALKLIGRVQRQHPGWADALVLSLGYYAETEEDATYNTALKKILVELGHLGIAVFCAAGNDASDRPSYPAAFAVDRAFDCTEMVPLVSVAALNPDGTVALFSNDGPWVTGEALGVNLVSTAPVGSDGSAGAGVRLSGPSGRPRAGFDPDDFVAGFASWSGTSFAAPVLAGQYLRALSTAGFPTISERRLLVPIGRGRARPAVASGERRVSEQSLPAPDPQQSDEAQPADEPAPATDRLTRRT